MISFPCLASVSTNVPLDHWAYPAMDRLVNYGFVDSDLLSTRPVSRLEMARLVVEARKKVTEANEGNRFVLATMGRLEREFKFEVNQFNSQSGLSSPSFLKPIEDPYVRLVHAQDAADLENRSGDLFAEGSNLRMGFATRGTFRDRYAFYVRPEFRSPSLDGRDLQIREAYGKVGVGSFEIQVGRDSLWWGPGYHGGLIMTNNAQPFPMFQLSNPSPILLPGMFRRLGPVRGFFFLTKLEAARNKPGARLSGIRLNMKPRPNVEVGFSRTIMFGGSGNADIGMGDYLQIFWPKNFQGEENQLAGFDASWRTPLPEFIPARSLKLYGEYVGEDAAGFHQFRPILGAVISDLFRTGRTDFRFEYAKTLVGKFPNVFYRHGVFASGYTYEGRIIGHHMGAGARELYARMTHRMTPDLILGVEVSQETIMSLDPRAVTGQIGLDLTWFAPGNLLLKAGYRHERYQNDPLMNGDNQIFDLSVLFDF